jgi:hypothetical protein
MGLEGAASVSCGEAHTLCLLRNGCVLAWGQNSCGQLGNGPSCSGMLSDCYRPVLLPHFGVAATVTASAAGAGAGAAGVDDFNIGRFVMKHGNDVYRAKISQLFRTLAAAAAATSTSSTSSTSSTLRDQLAREQPRSGPAAIGNIVCCGAFHSVCVTTSGLVYTWGARGSPCLGHNDSPLVGEWNRRVNHIFSISATVSRAMVPNELFHWCLTWATPRCVMALAGGPLQSAGGGGSGLEDDYSVSAGGGTAGAGSVYSADNHVSARQRVVQVCAGDLCTAFLTAEGRLFLCGSGPAVPNFMPASRVLQDVDAADGTSPGSSSARPTAAERAGFTAEQEKQQRAADKADMEEELMRLATVVGSPRCPSDSWLRELCTRKITSIAGSGNRLFALTDEEAVSQSLTAPLLNLLLSSSSSGPGEQQQQSHRNGKHVSGNNSVSDASGYNSSSSSQHPESIFESRGKADCMILASGKVFLCHKALIAQRSPELRNIIIMESPTDDSSGQMVQILLPELQRDGARALLHYLYRYIYLACRLALSWFKLYMIA